MTTITLPNELKDRELVRIPDVICQSGLRLRLQVSLQVNGGLLPIPVGRPGQPCDMA